jgi:hypothetical protein
MQLRTITPTSTLLASATLAAIALAGAPVASAASWTKWVPKGATSSTTTATTSARASTSPPAQAPAPAAPAAGGATGCTARTDTIKAYARLGDDADYVAAPGGTFEHGQGGWTFSRKTWPWDEGKVARIVAGNDGNDILPGASALEVQKDGYAISPRFCVDESHPHFRFSFRVTGWASTFDVLIVYRDLAGNLQEAQFVSSRNVTLFPGQWQVSPESPLATQIPLVEGGAAASVQIHAKVGNGTVQFDNFLVDPYRRR